MPLNARNAAEILKHLQGPEAPAEWQGGLPLKYRIGPGPVTLEMDVQNDERVGTLRSVIGVIRGREEPEKLVIVGNHLDAWTYGAVDPSSGTAALLEMARAFGEALKKGYRPRRTIVFANWDGEEPLLGGSTQWALDNAEQLRSNAVTYINVDTGVQGREFIGGATPALAGFLRDVTKAVQDPATGKPLHDVWAARFDRSRAGGRDDRRRHGLHGAARNTSAFRASTCTSTVRTASITRSTTTTSGRAPWSTRASATASRCRGCGASWRGDSPTPTSCRCAIPITRARPSATSRPSRAHAGSDKPLELEAARAAARRWEDAATQFEARLDKATLTPAATRAVNERLLQVERALVEPQGLRGRPFIRHLLVAPQPSYRSAYLPRIWDALDRNDRGAIPAHEAEIVAAFDRAAGILREATASARHAGDRLRRLKRAARRFSVARPARWRPARRRSLRASVGR